MFNILPYTGEPLLWYERCRIKHLLTQRYLAVQRKGDRYVLTLKERKQTSDFDIDTTFRLCPVITGEDEIKFETYARITHVYTKTWLHALKGTFACKRDDMYILPWRLFNSRGE